ncbi:UDP-N-acetylglucosamine 2-epimerase (non-hydrolyzing) [Acidovorax sp. SUPP2522]|uniref:non-hydrolyzing UDP-N-acetylglucosamine 2-epimerase n=1 Tax=unclassified Acidovorax TaxID=2684926 RepID=UPI00234B6506|nr:MULTISPECIES: UDP-N-acetylglucosamine 2-epimerase (non-hydrolyzing) [unclassified Acidovorax]WCM99266.1 UDP-N-acetylglucosamine 2-epimerase (non-hydrolyzing) [Acidovorax sp. GBBC 1281]GKT18690.1 UDP-N-acetylglucosamine 2-epimerase (non-hydrolyzing) [Acidovorax sp. SUPP2522]
MQDILIVSGTRPEIIKLAPLYHALRSLSWAHVHWLHTGQHDEMAIQMLDCFTIRPDIVLHREGSTLQEFSAGCRRQIDGVLQAKDYALVIVQGDTESAFIGALAGFYRGLPVAHVEAGLRTYNLARPFPEEGLRQMISRLAQFHFPPTSRSRTALRSEGIPDERIHVTGNTVVDAQHWTCTHHGVRRRTTGRGHLLVTFHRRESWGEGVRGICRAIADLARQNPGLQVLFPVHKNPVVREPVQALLGGIANIQLSDPLDYMDMQQALADAWLLLTDSGGLQEEAPTFGVPVLVLRDETERPEAVQAGCALLIGPSYDAIVSHVTRLLGDPHAHRQMAQVHSPFGDGQACQRIVSVLASHLVPAAPMPLPLAA